MNKAVANSQKHATEFLLALARIPDRARNKGPEGAALFGRTAGGR
jgi:hypothetical protein